jgi:hypothetical protein
MTKDRVALPAKVFAEQDPFFIASGGPLAHDSSGRDDEREHGASGESGCRIGTASHQPTCDEINSGNHLIDERVWNRRLVA